jgi:acyl-homoserine-lactone acylase
MTESSHRVDLALVILGATLLALTACTGVTTTPEPPAAPDAPAAEPSALVEGRAEILWDRWGIPHIRARDTESLFYAFGWAQAHNHAELLLREIGASRGRAAEYWGDQHSEDDRWLRALAAPEQGEALYRATTPEMRRWLDAFAEGANAFLAEQRETVADELAVVLPLTGWDITTHTVAVTLRFSQARQARDRWLAARELPAEADKPVAAGEAHWDFSEPVAASNAWAVAPARSRSEHAILVANPHLPWSGNLTWMEARLSAPGIDVYGASIVGLPVINIGFTPHVAWTHTVNTQDVEDLFELTLEGEGYRFGGEVRAFESREVGLLVRDGETPRREPLELLWSVHGPVIAVMEDAALALRRVEMVAPSDPFLQWWEMARATSLEELEAAMARHHAIVGQNVLYADAAGNIGYHYGAATPRREAGDFAFWSRILPGDDPSLVWEEAYEFGEMPRVVNPPTGWVQNANDPPWWATWPAAVDPEAFPPYFAPLEMGPRARRSLRMLVESGELDFETIVELKHSTRVELADTLVPPLVAAASEAEGELARRAAEVLSAWDRHTEADSRGAVLFRAWLLAAGPPTRLFAQPFDPEDPLGTPSGLADPATAVAALEEAAAAVEAAHGALDVPWGEVFRLRQDDLDLPANGGPGALGIFRVTGFQEDDDGLHVAVGGDSFVAVVELSDPPRAQALIGYGNASRPGSPHRTDQLALYAENRLRPVPATWEEVEAAAVERTVLPNPEPPSRAESSSAPTGASRQGWAKAAGMVLRL